MMATNRPSHFKLLDTNIAEVERLLEIHRTIAGGGPGRKHKVEVLNKSAVVLLVACWEAFVEHLATNAFDHLFKHATNPQIFPTKVLTEASRDLKETPDETKLWNLAGDGWKKVLRKHRMKLLGRHVDTFNTPRAERIDRLFERLVGFKHLSFQWTWQGMPRESAVEKLDSLVTLRGEIAHQVGSSAKVGKGRVEDYIGFVQRLAVISSNRLRTHLRGRTEKFSWPSYKIGGVR